ncbi:(4Fe-4S)-binding protein [Siphonobacter aquaeclarae]|jgi:uncharacterized Fe-S cluster protein YjdI|uniref:Uncharacterized Fe-S cluster protein YjdI n=1 Tax=Siphonobacter aquaeclarae TaxID=563176 RepID=A0A1G9WE95_9BACT|nr:(4Fe-4S)-binding protein [Siphonobacter aquaeclarae]MBO9639726.1 (4Fe-4S)-binding protein [Siphonobacter aquaeclarae]SDM82627.1 Uncharacterized Fe-S cluster protein YjdI [Siphonobacter aquaeclarae]
MNIIKQYTRDGLTVTWEPSKCIHSTFCWRQLSAVFDPRKHPWINMEGAETDRIREQVKACPSGALSFSEEPK